MPRQLCDTTPLLRQEKDSMSPILVDVSHTLTHGKLKTFPLHWYHHFIVTCSGGIESGFLCPVLSDIILFLVWTVTNVTQKERKGIFPYKARGGEGNRYSIHKSRNGHPALLPAITTIGRNNHNTIFLMVLPTLRDYSHPPLSGREAATVAAGVVVALPLPPTTVGNASRRPILPAPPNRRSNPFCLIWSFIRTAKNMRNHFQTISLWTIKRYLL